MTSADSAPIGTYDIVVNELARAQVTATTSTHANKDTTTVATGGSLSIGGVTVTISGAVTLQGLADALNATNAIAVEASVVANGSNSYQLVLTGDNTGATNAFTLTNSLTGGSGVAFTDTDSDGTTGDSPADNAVQATDASATVNQITVTSATNTLTDAIPNATLTLMKKDSSNTVTVTVSQDDAAVTALVDDAVSAYNDLTAYLDEQFKATSSGNDNAIGGDSLLRGLRSAIQGNLTSAYSVGGSYKYLAEIGIESTRSGTLSRNGTLFDKALSENYNDVKKLFIGDGSTDGAFATLANLVTTYTQSGGFLPEARQSLDTEVSRLDTRIINYEDRLASREAALQQEFVAADLAMAQLNSQASSLGSLGSEYRLF